MTSRAWIVTALLCAGCGGSAAPPKEASTASSTEPAPPSGGASAPKAADTKPAESTKAAESTGTAAGGEPSPAGTAGSEPQKSESVPSESGPSRSPTDILGAPKAAFILDYQASGAAENAEKKCDAESRGDAAKRAECVKKARAELRAEVLQFKKSANGKWTLTVYERNGTALPEVYHSDIDLIDEKKDSVTVRFKAKQDKGARPIFAGASQMVVSVPNDYGIVLNDPKFGKLVYNQKIGLVGD